MRLLFVLMFGVGASAANATDFDALYRGLQTSDTRAVTGFVETYYREAGISVNDTLSWDSQPFDEIVNWYNPYSEVIMLSDLPQPAEVAPYWENWSEVLTQGTWNWRGFFRDDTEAALMANFNQFLLAAHEYGHALTFRYDPEHERRYDQEINCREYLPDRLAAALLEEVAQTDPRIAALKARYRALIDEINAHIAPQFRYDAPSFAALDADCRVMHVEQPTEDTMTPYASAFFIRHGLLQAEDLPPLAEVYATHLLPYWHALQPAESRPAGPVTTLDAVNVDTAVADGGLRYESRDLVYDPNGTLYVIETGEDTTDTPPMIRFSYGPAGAPIEIAIPPRALTEIWLSDTELLNFTSRMALGPDHFAALSGGSFLGGVRILLFDIRRAGGIWTFNVIDLEPDSEVWENTVHSAMVLGADGTPHVFLLDYRETGNRWRRLTLDPDTFAVAATTTFTISGFDHPVAVGPRGETYFFDEYQIVVVGDDGVPRSYAGARLQGFKDNSDPLLAEFALESSVVHLLAGGGMEVLDYDPAARTYVRRRVAPAP